MAERSGVEIDYCPQCRGVWLDRGELDKIIERNASTGGTRPEEPGPGMGLPADRYPAASTDAYRRDERHHDHDDHDRHDDHHDEHGVWGRQEHGGRKKKSFLGDLFDF